MENGIVAPSHSSSWSLLNLSWLRNFEPVSDGSTTLEQHLYGAEAYGLLSFVQSIIHIKTDSQGVLNTLQIGDPGPQENEEPIGLDKGGAVILGCLCSPDWEVLIRISSYLHCEAFPVSLSIMAKGIRNKNHHMIMMSSSNLLVGHLKPMSMSKPAC